MRPNTRREKKTIQVMIELYCRKHHDNDTRLCPSCKELLDYAFQRIEYCPFRESKPTCKNCPIHCYQPEARQKIREVMRFSGPRMLFHHPILALMHLLDSNRKTSLNKKGG